MDVKDTWIWKTRCWLTSHAYLRPSWCPISVTTEIVFRDAIFIGKEQPIIISILYTSANDRVQGNLHPALIPLNK